MLVKSLCWIERTYQGQVFRKSGVWGERRYNRKETYGYAIDDEDSQYWQRLDPQMWWTGDLK